jgi:hypothetical protein
MDSLPEEFIRKPGRDRKPGREGSRREEGSGERRELIVKRNGSAK